jgi:type VI secretion system protein VasJ
MSLDFDAMLLPISDAAPGGSDNRESEAFEQMNLEMEKLTSLTSDGIPNWIKIEQLSSQFLQTQSKDYLVAAWLAESWVQRNAMQGLACGLSLLAGMADQFWDTGFPTVLRLRGRRNAILWWVERATKWLEAQHEVTVTTELLAQMSTAAKALDQTLSDKDPDAPSLATLIGFIHRLPVEEPPKVEEPATALPAGSAQSEPNAANSPSNAAIESPLSQTNQTPATTTSANTTKLGTLEKPSQINNFDDLGAALRPAQEYTAMLGPALYAFDNSNPLVIHFSRFAARSGIFKLPNATGGKTLISCPPSAIRDAFEKITNSKNPQGIVDFCESRIRTFPFWFDLDYQSFRGFSMMGVAGNLMAHTIAETLLNFMGRLPNIEQLTFSDGTPFASIDTLAWIKRCRQERSGSGPTDAFEAVKNTAMMTLGEGNLEQALTELQTFIDNTRSKRDQFRARVELANILLTERPTADLRALVQPLVEDCTQLQLDQWEPSLAAQAWALKFRAARQVATNKSAEITEDQRAAARLEAATALKHLSITDFSQAARLA